VTNFLLVRHGMTDEIGQVLSGWGDVALNAQGTVAVQALAARLASVRLSALYTSPLARARQTAALIAAPHRLTPVVEPGVGEVRYGAFTGRSFDALHAAPGWSRWNAFRSGARIPDGETMIEVQARVVAALLRMRDAHGGGNVVVVSHGDAIKAAVGYVLGSPIDLMLRLEVEPASVTELELRDDGARVLGVNRRA
jgi:probable phosphoglycerate mutase